MSAQVFVLSIIALAVGLPVTLAMVAEIAKRQIKFKERKLELMADMTAEKAAQYAAHVERLEQRMRVLERIATDKGVTWPCRLKPYATTPSSHRSPMRN